MELKRIHNLFLMEIDIVHSKNAEEIVKDYFEERGYNTIKFNSRTSNCIMKDQFDSITHRLIKGMFPFLEDMIKYYKLGTPDFLIFRGSYKLHEDGLYRLKLTDFTDWFFCEVKGPRDTISQEQLRWYATHQEYPVILCFVDSKITHNDFKGKLNMTEDERDE